MGFIYISIPLVLMTCTLYKVYLIIERTNPKKHVIRVNSPDTMLGIGICIHLLLSPDTMLGIGICIHLLLR